MIHEDIETRLHDYNFEKNPGQLERYLKHRAEASEISTRIGEQCLMRLQIIKLAYLLGYEIAINDHIYKSFIEPKIPEDSLVENKKIRRSKQNKIDNRIYRVSGVRTAMQTLGSRSKLEYTTERFHYALGKL